MKHSNQWLPDFNMQETQLDSMVKWGQAKEQALQEFLILIISTHWAAVSLVALNAQ